MFEGDCGACRSNERMVLDPRLRGDDGKRAARDALSTPPSGNLELPPVALLIAKTEKERPRVAHSNFV